jgi:hypothetical protein
MFEVISRYIRYKLGCSAAQSLEQLNSLVASEILHFI